MGKKKREVLDAEFVGFSDGHDGQRLLDGGRSRRCGTSWSRSPTTRSTRRTPRRTAWCPTGPPTSRPTSRPSTWRRCSPASRDDKDKSALYLNECRRMGIKVLPPDVNESDSELHPARHRHPLRPVRDPQRRRQRRGAHRGHPRGKGRFTDFYDFLRKVDPVVCNKKTRRVADQGRRVRLARRPAPRPAQRARRGDRLVHAHQAERGARPVRPVRRRASGDDDGRRVRAHRDPPVPIGEWDKSVLLQYEREMLGLYVSDHPLFGVEHVLTAAAPTARSRR